MAYLPSRWSNVATTNGLRVVILSNVPEVADVLTTTVTRLGHDPAAVVAARRRKPTPGLNSIDASTELKGTKVVIVPEKAAVEPTLRSLKPDVLMSWSFPWLVTGGALALPTLGAINFHPSLLPRHRGPNPVAWTIRMGDSDYGITWHRMSPEYDCGPILAQRSTPVLDEDTVSDVQPRLTTLGLRMLRGVFVRLIEGDPGDPQPMEGATLAEPFGEDYATIDWSRSAREIHDQVRAWSFTAGTHSVIGPMGELDGHAVRITRTTLREPEVGGCRINCGDGPLWILEYETLNGAACGSTVGFTMP
jgi:methionyl-tRNA formyltransferase